MSADVAVVACDNLLPYLEAAQEAEGTALPVFTVDRSLHNEPASMKEVLLRTIEELPSQYQTVLVAMGFCGGAWDQVVAPRKLVIPRVDDCISLLLSDSCDEASFQPYAKEPWRLYVYENEPGDFTIDRMMNDVSQDGQFEGMSPDFLRHALFDNYRNVDIIDTGLNDCYSEEYVIAAQAFADELNAELGYAQGGIGMLRNLVAGRWDSRFVVAEPGTLVRHGSFFS